MIELDWTDKEAKAYRQWTFLPDPPNSNEDPGEPWEIQERAWLGGARVAKATTLREVTDLIKTRIAATQWSSDARRLKLLLADIEKL